MDPFTHAASGAVAYLCLPRRPLTLCGGALAAAACAAPDIDLAFIHTPLEFLLIHRGISHSFAAAPIFGLLLALCCWPLWRPSTPQRWRFSTVWLFCIGMILLHIWLDVCTTYGTMVFLPFSHYRVRLNSIYIIDLLITVPLLLTLCFWRARRKICLAVLAWTFVFPASGVAINAWHTNQAARRFAEEGRTVTRMHVLPDAFAPIFWRLIFEEGDTVRELSLDWRGQPRNAGTAYPAPKADFVASLEEQSASCFDYFHFAMLPIIDSVPREDRPDNMPLGENTPLYRFYDLRFGSGLDFVRRLLAMRPNADIPFQLMVEMAPKFESPEDFIVSRVRLRFSDSGRDSHWHSPRPPRPPDWLQWIFGIR